ncbi:Holin of 3TMs, for gene-transfer release [uncultured Thiomicrorhabdus sp.]
MFSWVGRLFGTEKAINDILDKDTGHVAKLGSWVGKLNFTEEERAAWGIDQLRALEPFKIVQRIIALSVMMVWVFTVVNVVGSIWIESYFGVPISEPMLAFAFSDFIFWPVLAVLSLYVSGGVFPKIKGAK